MTEAEWLTCTDPAPMLEFLRGKASDRKLRLFAVACCRQAWQRLPGGESRFAVELAEGAADDPSLIEDLPYAPAYDRRWVLHKLGVVSEPGDLAVFAAYGTTYSDGGDAASRAVECGIGHCALLRDIFGPLPFWPVSSDPTWLAWHGGAIPKLARSVYDERELPSGHLDPARLAVLADMLEEAGCSNAEVLGHLRGPGPHVLGCHVLDAVLGKS